MDMYSDNETNFIGANRELTKAYCDALQDPDFLNRTALDRMSWHFMPPHVPYFEGLWEAGICSVKHHLWQILGSHTLTFEKLATLLCRIETCLNSRLLGPLTDSYDKFAPLTPGHFLISFEITSPKLSVLHLKENCLSRWQLIRQLTKKFWRIWQMDYINMLQQKAK
ncbi:uncharacterized protein LOC105200985 [Solenopsis invicta]|uniref:uncharacterized protein LOC105200985 n=1 Tax=Solenopsis invicta TaxID=13686 RepID=UPI0005960234|nr:uncharacterized protein LOC105200985 [Solenopsis invicta]